MGMNNTWFTSDTHFGHTNILEYEKEARPFSSLEEMHERLIDNWNSVVRPNDTVYHLGDFCFGKKNIDIAGRLQGKKRLVMGNHDTYASADYLKHFDKLYGVFYWKMCVLTHIPVHPENLGSRAFLNLHGHLHSKRVMHPGTHFAHAGEFIFIHDKDDRNYFNVSVEQNNLMPFHADQILLRLKEIEAL